jgi:hypothetical protein
MKRNKRTEAASCIKKSQKALSFQADPVDAGNLPALSNSYAFLQAINEPWISRFDLAAVDVYRRGIQADRKKATINLEIKPAKPLTSKQIISANRKFLKSISARRRSSVRAQGERGASVSDRIQPRLSDVAVAGTKSIKGRVSQFRRRRVKFQGVKFDFCTINEAPLTKSTYRRLCRTIKRSAIRESKARLKDYFKFKPR